MKRASRHLLSALLATVGAGFLVLSPTVGATTINPPYTSSLYPATVTQSNFGTSPVDLYALVSTSTSTGALVFWQNSTVGQGGPSTAEVSILQGFETGAVRLTMGYHVVSLKWLFTGEAIMKATCFSSVGAATMRISQSAEYNLYNGSSNFYSSNPTTVDWTYTLSSTCPTSNSKVVALTGSWTAAFASVYIPATLNYQIWGYLYTDTKSVETSATDVIATSCIDYTLTTGTCFGPDGGTGIAVLNSVTIS